MVYEVRTHGTTANIAGPLFDKGGGRLKHFYMTATAELTAQRGLQIVSNGAYPVPIDSSNFAYQLAKKLAADKAVNLALRITYHNDMKPGGIGTSAAGAFALVELFNQAFKLGLTPKEKIWYASFAEPDRHLDNIIPCAIGDITVSEGTADDFTFTRYDASAIVPAVIVPLDITKVGGTKAARDALKDRVLTDDDQQKKKRLENLAEEGIKENNFGKIWASIDEYNHWEKSETWLRNQKGVYQADVIDMMSLLKAEFQQRAIIGPSGAGPAMLILANDPELAAAAVVSILWEYERNGKNANGTVTSFV